MKEKRKQSFKDVIVIFLWALLLLGIFDSIAFAGAFIANIHFKTEDQKAVIRVLDKIYAQGYYRRVDLQTLPPYKRFAYTSDYRRVFVSPSLNGWVSIFDSLVDYQSMGLIKKICSQLSKKFHTTAITFVVHDSDTLWYVLFKDGKLIDRYDSWPDYFGKVSKKEKDRLKGKPEMLLDLCPKGTTGNEIRKILDEKNPFAEDNLSNLAELLKLSNVLYSYEYLATDFSNEKQRRENIEGWEKFRHLGYKYHSFSPLKGWLSNLLSMLIVALIILIVIQKIGISSRIGIVLFLIAIILSLFYCPYVALNGILIIFILGFIALRKAWIPRYLNCISINLEEEAKKPDYFENKTRELNELGFEIVDDYKQQDPHPSVKACARVLVKPSDYTYAELVESISKERDSYVLSFSTRFIDNKTALVTSNFNCSWMFDIPPQNIRKVFSKRKSVQYLYQRHKDKIEKMLKEGNQPVEVSKEIYLIKAKECWDWLMKYQLERGILYEKIGTQRLFFTFKGRIKIILKLLLGFWKIGKL